MVVAAAVTLDMIQLLVLVVVVTLVWIILGMDLMGCCRVGSSGGGGSGGGVVLGRDLGKPPKYIPPALYLVRDFRTPGNNQRTQRGALYSGRGA